MNEEEIKLAQDLEAILVFNCVMAGNLDKECFGHEETLHAISERNPLISKKIFRSKVSGN